MIKKKSAYLIKIMAVACMCFTWISTCHAQNNVATKYGFRLGLTAHPTFGMISAGEGNNRGTNLGFAYGVMADFNVAEHYSFSTAVTITTINGKSREINAMPYHMPVSIPNPMVYDLKYKMQYLEIPFMLKLKTSTVGQMKWFGQVGLSNGFKIRARQDAENANGVLANEVNSSKWTRFYRAGLLIGGGAEFDLDGSTSLVTGLSFNNGLTTITTSENRVRNHYVALNLSVFF